MLPEKEEGFNTIFSFEELLSSSQFNPNSHFESENYSQSD